MMSTFTNKISEFVQTRALGHEAQLDALPTPPTRLYTDFCDSGLGNWWIGKDYGGRGLSLEQSVAVVEELAYADAGLAFSLFIGVIGSSVIELFGSPAQKDRFLRPMAELGVTSATLGSERLAGSELLNIETHARRQADHWMISGDKYFSTNAGFADYWMVVAKAEDPDKFKALLIAKPLGKAGVEVQRRWPMIGVRGSATYQIRLQDCQIPLDSTLPGNGVRVLEVGLNPSRTLIAATAIGIARRIRDLSLDYAGGKRVKGEPLLNNAVFAAKLGQLEVDIEVMRSVCRTAAREYDQLRAGPDGAAQLLAAGSLKSTVTAKLVCGQIGWRVASVGSEMFGGLGYTEDCLIGKLVRDMRYIAVVEGGEDVLRDFVYYRHVLPEARRRGASQ